MGRKKKEVTQEKIEVKETVENKSSQNIGYSGNVSISFIRGGRTVKKTYHNNGTELFFAYIMNFVGQKSNPENRMPSQIRAYKDNAPLFASSVTKNSSVETGRYVDPDTEEASGYYAKLTFIVPASVILQNEVCNKLELTNNISEPLAILTDDSGEGFFTGDGRTNLKIEWTMILKNS